ncbi:TrbG/VirB9 family P-type conjugative transfer protein [Rhizobium beringeri]
MNDSKAIQNQTFKLQFMYPEDVGLKGTAELWKQAQDAERNPNIKNIRRDKVNYDYGFKGSDAAKPLWVFDDGLKTFMKFTGDVPAIFIVDNKRRESLVNYRREADYIVIDTVSRQWTLRYGTENETCLFNLRTAPADVPALIEGAVVPSGSARAASLLAKIKIGRHDVGSELSFHRKRHRDWRAGEALRDRADAAGCRGICDRRYRCRSHFLFSGGEREPTVDNALGKSSAPFRRREMKASIRRRRRPCRRCRCPRRRLRLHPLRLLLWFRCQPRSHRQSMSIAPEETIPTIHDASSSPGRQSFSSAYALQPLSSISPNRRTVPPVLRPIPRSWSAWGNSTPGASTANGDTGGAVDNDRAS